jgi:hypothetical protein
MEVLDRSWHANRRELLAGSGTGSTAMTGAQFEVSIDGANLSRSEGARFTGRADPEVQKSQQCGEAERFKERERDRRRVQVGATIMKMLVLPQRPIAGLAQVQEPAGVWMNWHSGTLTTLKVM